VQGDTAASAAPESYRYLNRPHSANADDVCTRQHQLLSSYQPGQIISRNSPYLLRRVTATNHIVGLMGPVMIGSYRHLSAKKLCLIKRDPFFHHMECSIGYLMSQDAVSDQRSDLALPPVGMFVPEPSELRIMSDP
jgi:hypothetical protein